MTTPDQFLEKGFAFLCQNLMTDASLWEHVADIDKATWNFLECSGKHVCFVVENLPAHSYRSNTLQIEFDDAA